MKNVFIVKLKKTMFTKNKYEKQNKIIFQRKVNNREKNYISS